LAKSKTYQGLDWFWKPDEVVPDTSAGNKGFYEINYLTYSGGAGTGTFGVCVPLKSIFNFCSDYNKVMWGLKHRIRMTRATATRALFRTNNAAIAVNGIFSASTAVNVDAYVNITTLRWCMPVVRPSSSHEQALLEIVGNNSQFIDVTFLNKRTNSIALPAATTFTWPLATTSGVKRPRYIVILFQVGNYTDQTSNSSAYSNTLNVTNGYITLSGVKYPSIDMNTDQNSNKYSKW